VIAGEAQLKPCFPVMAKMALQTAGSTEGIWDTSVWRLGCSNRVRKSVRPKMLPMS